MTSVKSRFPVLHTAPVTVRLFGTLVTMGLAQPLVTVRLGQGQNTLNEQVSLLVTHWPRLHTLQPALFVAQTVFGASGAVSVPHATTVSVNGPHRFPVGL